MTRPAVRISDVIKALISAACFSFVLSTGVKASLPVMLLAGLSIMLYAVFLLVSRERGFSYALSFICLQSLNTAQAFSDLKLLNGLYVVQTCLVFLALSFVLFWACFNKQRIIDVCVFTLIVFSFRVFDRSLLDNEFLFVHLLTLVTGVEWLVSLDQTGLPRIRIRTLLALGSLFGACVAATVTGFCPLRSLVQLAIMADFVFLGFIVAHHDRSLFKWVIAGLAANAVSLVSLIIVEKFFFPSQYPMFFGRRLFIGLDSNSPVHANTVAGFFIAFIFIFSGLKISGKARVPAWFFNTCFCLMLSLIVLTFSRLGMLALLAAGLFVLFRTGHALVRKIFVTALFGLLLSVALIPDIRNFALARFKDNSSTEISVYNSGLAFSAFSQHPLTGVGLDTYYPITAFAEQRPYGHDRWGILTTKNVVQSPAHSLYAETALCAGIIGMAALFWLIAEAVLACGAGSAVSLWCCFLFASFLTFLVHGILSLTFHLTILPAFFWVIAGLLLSNSAVAGKARRPAVARIVICLFLCFHAVFFIIVPFLSGAHYSRALGLFHSGDTRAAEKENTAARALLPFDPRTCVLQAAIEGGRGDQRARERWLKEALRFQRNYPQFIEDLGDIYLSRGLKKEAISAYLTAVSLDPYGVWDREHNTSLGLALLSIEDRAGAYTAFRDAVIRSPSIARDPQWGGRAFLPQIINEMEAVDVTIEDGFGSRSSRLIFIQEELKKALGTD
ncbi:MAG: O-antigen ligase family protein [Deltaproteobacteria bacterium]